MSFTKIGVIAAALIGTLTVGASAEAQRREVVVQRTTVHRTVVGPRRIHRPRRVCTVRFRHGERIRRCHYR